MKRESCLAFAVALSLVAATGAQAQVKYAFEHAGSIGGLSFAISSSDLLHGLPASSVLLNPDLAGIAPGYMTINNMQPCGPSPINSPNADISGFHGASGDPLLAKMKVINGQAGGDLDVVLADFAWPSAVFQFDLAQPSDIGEIRIFAANTLNADGRVFQNYDVEISTDTNTDSKQRVFTPLIQRVITSSIACADSPPPPPDRFVPSGNDGSITATLTRVYDASSPVMATGVTSVRFTFWGVSNTLGAFQDQWLGAGPPASPECPPPDGVNPATYFDVEDFDGFKRAFEGTVLREIDIFPVRGPIETDCENNPDHPDCRVDPVCPPEVCDDGIDNTDNGLTDCDDPDCRDAQVCLVEICDDGIDNTGNGLIDCEDPQCFDHPACLCNTPWADADGDGDVDHDDFAIFQRCYTGPGGGIPTIDEYACSCFDRNDDGSIDQQDFIAFKDCAGGPDLPPAPGCED
jgi:hypothetical protein